MYGDAAIVGYGETEYHKDDQRHPLEYLHGAIDLALRDAGLSIEEVDGLSTASFSLADVEGHTVPTLAEHLGIGARWLLHGTFGGASSVAGILRGARAISSGRADVVVVAAADSYTPDSHMEHAAVAQPAIRNYHTPYGHGGANGLFALIQRRHMHEFGTTREELANVSVTQREHARRNPRALLREPMTVERYLDARPIVEPIHLYDCVLPCGAGGAVVLASRERAAELDVDPVYLLAGDEYHNPYPPGEEFPLYTGLRYCEDVFAAAGVSRDDVDAVQLYDDYPIMVAIQLEDLGFCAKGEGGTFVAETDLSTEGDLPLNTGGGQLSVGQAGAQGGMLGPVEAVRQLRGEGGDRQVPGCELVLADGFGRVSYGGGLSAGVTLLSAEPPEEVGA